ncbi:hypothetical protein Tco_0722412 [Tanacetum coccineum]
MVLMLVQQREGEEEGLMSCVYNMQRVKWKYGWWCLKACKLLETLVLLSLKMRHVAPTDLESSKESGSEPQTPLPQLKNLQGASPSSEVITLIYQDHSPRERPGLGSMTHTKPKTKESSNKSVSGPVTVCDTEPVTSSVPTEVKINDQESKIDELTKLVQMDNYHGEHLFIWRTVLLWRTVECKFNGKITVVILVRDRCPRGKGYQNPFNLKKAQRIKPTLYDGIVMSDKHVATPVIDDEETLILEEESRSKMSKKAKDPELRMSDPTSKPSDALPVKIKAPKELPKISLVNESLKKLKFHLAKFDNVVKIRTTPNARTEGKEIVDIDAQIPSVSTIVPGMFKLDLEPLAPRLLQNREMHIEYLKYTQEQVDILRGIVEQAKAKQPLDKELDFALQKRLLSHLKTRSRKLGLKCSISKCGSKPIGHTKNDRISRPTSRNMKNKVEAQPRKVNKKNRVVEPICDDNVKYSKLNANSNLNCATCSSKTAKIVESKNDNHSEPNNTWGSNATDIPSSSSLVIDRIPDFSLENGLPDEKAFLNFFNDPRIIREQRIAAYKGYRGGGHMGDDVESLGAVLERLWCKVEVDGGGFGSCGVRG